MFLWQAAILLERFYSYPKKVNVEIVQKPIPFPSVSICNTDHLDLEYVSLLQGVLFGHANPNNRTAANSSTSTNSSKDMDDFMADYTNFSDQATTFLNAYTMWKTSTGKQEEAWSQMIELFSRHGLTANLGPDMASQAGVKLEDFIVSCQFLGKSCNVTTSFKTYFDPYYFNCFTFQPHATLPTRAMRLQGLEYGLSLLLFSGSAGQLTPGNGSGKYNLIPGMQESDSALASGKGARVVVHSPNTVPHPTAEGYDIPPGFSVNVGVKARENVRIRPPHGNCSDSRTTSDKCKSSSSSTSSSSSSKCDKAKSGDSTTEGGEEDTSYKYTLISCQNTCIRKAIMNTCRCVDNHATSQDDMDDYPFCLFLPRLPEECNMSPSTEEDLDLPPPGEYMDSYPDTNGGMYDPGDYAFPDPGGEGMSMKEMEMEMMKTMFNNLPKVCRDTLNKFDERMQCKKDVYENMTIRNPMAMEHCYCYPPCNDIVYDASYSLSILPEWTDEHSAFYADVENYMENYLSPEKKAILEMNIKEGGNYRQTVFKFLSRLNVHIADSNIMKTIEAPDYEAIRLISDLGGQLGLWIGISVMTLFEVLQLFADVLRYLTSSGRQFGERKIDTDMVVNLPREDQYNPHRYSEEQYVPNRYGNGDRFRHTGRDVEQRCEIDKLTTV